jgi:hypothetical protein
MVALSVLIRLGIEFHSICTVVTRIPICFKIRLHTMVGYIILTHTTWEIDMFQCRLLLLLGIDIDIDRAASLSC